MTPGRRLLLSRIDGTARGHRGRGALHPGLQRPDSADAQGQHWSPPRHDLPRFDHPLPIRDAQGFGARGVSPERSEGRRREHRGKPLALPAHGSQVQPCHAERSEASLLIETAPSLRGGVTIEGSSTSDPKRKQQKSSEEASEDEAILRLYHD